MKKILYFISCLLVLSACGEKIIGYETAEEYVDAMGASAEQKILYETTDKNTIRVEGNVLGDANVVANIYNGNMGVIVCNKPITTIDEGKFKNSVRLKAIQLPKSVSRIEKEAFSECGNLELVALPESRHTIGESTFYGCTKLEVVNNSGYATEIGESAFQDCESLKGYNGIVTLNAVIIGASAFQNCKSLKSVEFGDKHSEAVGSSLKIIDELAFCKCESLSEIDIPNSVTNIGSYAFQHCTSLGKVTIGENVVLIDKYAFSYCDALSEVVIPDNVNEIGAYAFAFCSSLGKVTIGSSVSSIGAYAFKGSSFGLGQYKSTTCVVCKPTTPPKLAATPFPTVHDLSPLYYYIDVPNRAIYMAEPTWAKYDNSSVSIY